MLPVPRAAVPLPVPVRTVSLAILSSRLAQEGEGEGEKGGHASGTGNIADHLPVIADATAGTIGRAHEPLRVTSDEGTRAPALARPITGMRDNVAAPNERFLRNELYVLCTPIYCRFLPNYSTVVSGAA